MSLKFQRAATSNTQLSVVTVVTDLRAAAPVWACPECWRYGKAISKMSSCPLCASRKGIR